MIVLVSSFFLIPFMVTVPLVCPFCGSDQVGKNGTSFGKQRYLCKKEKELSFVNETYLKCRKDCKIQVEMDEMWSYYKATV